CFSNPGWVGPFHCFAGQAEQNEFVSVWFNDEGLEIKGQTNLFIPWTGIVTVKKYKNDHFRDIRILVTKETSKFLPKFGNFGNGQKIYFDVINEKFTSNLMDSNLITLSQETDVAVTYDVVNYQPAKKMANFWKRLGFK